MGWGRILNCREIDTLLRSFISEYGITRLFPGSPQGSGPRVRPELRHPGGLPGQPPPPCQLQGGAVYISLDIYYPSCENSLFPLFSLPFSSYPLRVYKEFYGGKCPLSQYAGTASVR